MASPSKSIGKFAARKKTRDRTVHLDHEDERVWGLVTKTITPMHPNRRHMTGMGKPLKPLLSKPLGYASNRSEQFRSFSKPPQQAGPEEQIDIRADKATRRGKVRHDRTIDLHDLTQDQAFERLENCIHTAHLRGQRNVLVVTGKGINLQGILRNNLPLWLADPRLRPMIASYAPAHIRHGGAGAFYVFLKRKI